MKKWKQLTAFALAAATVISLLPSAPAQAASKKKTVWVPTQTKQYTYSSDEQWNEFSSYKCTYNKKGKLTSDSYMGTDKTISKTKYKYDSKGYISTVTYYKNNKKTGKDVYTRNKKGYTTKVTSYDEKNKLESTTTYKLNSKGDWTKRTTTYTQKGKKKVVETVKYTYKKNQIVKEDYKYGDDYETISEYTNKGEVKKFTWKDEDGSSTTTYTYKGGRVSKSVFQYTSKDKSYTDKITYTYKYKTDKNKNVTEEIQYKEDGTPMFRTVYSGYKKIPVSSK